MHKYVKCLDVAVRRVYISRDVVFDEIVFPFSKLHPNAGSLLCQQILLIPDYLKNNSALDQGGQQSTDLTPNTSANFVPSIIP
jgi:hypothetical protein